MRVKDQLAVRTKEVVMEKDLHAAHLTKAVRVKGQSVVLMKEVVTEKDQHAVHSTKAARVKDQHAVLTKEVATEKDLHAAATNVVMTANAVTTVNQLRRVTLEALRVPLILKDASALTNFWQTQESARAAKLTN